MDHTDQTGTADSEILHISRAELHAIIENAIKERDAKKLEELHKRDKESPEEHRMRSMKYYNENKHIINAKRRAAYRSKTSSITDVISTQSMPIEDDNISSSQQITILDERSTADDISSEWSVRSAKYENVQRQKLRKVKAGRSNMTAKCAPADETPRSLRSAEKSSVACAPADETPRSLRSAEKSSLVCAPADETSRSLRSRRRK